MISRRIVTSVRLLMSVVLLVSASVGSAAEKLQVATLHPLLSDLAQQVGGDLVEVVPLMGEGADPHAFEPTPGDLKRSAGSRLILASGKGMETYLDRIQGNLRPGQEIYEVGRKVPSLTIEKGAVFVCCPHHSHGAIDPHWWHSISAMQRAARYLASEFSRVDPSNAKVYRANAKAYDKELDQLMSWAKKEISRIPRSDRKLATAHAAFGYFCKEFGFKAVPIQGLNRERDPSPQYLAETIDVLRDQKVKAVFPELLANPKILESMVRESGVKMAGSLIADGIGSGAAATYEGMIRANVSTIVQALAEE